MTGAGFAVVQAKFEPIEPAALEDALMTGGKIPKADASRAARRARGFLAQRLTRPQADEIAQRLIARGYSVRVLAMNDLADAGKPVSVAWLRMTPESLGVPIGGQETIHDIPWSGVFVVNAGHLSVLEQQVQEKDVFRTSRGHAITEYQRTSHSERHPALEIIGVSNAGSLIYLRLLSLRMQGNKMPGIPLDQPRHMQFFEVLERVVHGATAAFISPETRKMLADRRADRTRTEGSVQFEADERAFAEYSRWLLQLVMFRETEQGRA
jgi:hypothetical protein